MAHLLYPLIFQVKFISVLKSVILLSIHRESLLKFGLNLSQISKNLKIITFSLLKKQETPKKD